MKRVKITYEFDLTNAGEKSDHAIVSNVFRLTRAMKDFLNSMNAVRHRSDIGKPFDCLKSEAMADRLAGKYENFEIMRANKDADWALEQFTDALEANGLSVDIFDEN